MLPNTPAVRLRSIDFLRGLAALAVAFGHALTAAPYDFAGRWFEQLCLHVMWIAINGIPLFFVVSGFCIHLGQVRHGSTFQFGAFWRRRLWRLYPTYFVALLASIALLLLMWASGTSEEMLDMYPEPRPAWIGFDFILHALMLHGLYPAFDQGAGNPSLWTLAREEYLYLMYPALLALRPRVAWYTLAALLAALSVVFQYGLTRLVTTSEANWLLLYSAPALWIQWHLGVVAADAYRGAIRLPAFWRQARWVPVWMLLGYLFKPGTVFLGLAFFTAVNACAHREAEGRWPSHGIVGAISRVGLWSYSLYLIHFPVLTIALAASRLVVSDVGVAGFVARAVLLTAISCIAGRLLFELVERHFVTLPRRTDDAPLAPAA
ncbi:MAG TPA: acyltransferase [Vicinamibacterales bacterium]|nr:acyltransferase [Vicinamibacterales bacterium]